MACRLSRPYAGCLALLVVTSPVLAQYSTPTPDAQPNNYPPALPARRVPGPVLTFTRIGEIALPAPLAGKQAWLAGELVAVPVAGGVVKVVPSVEAEAKIGADEERPKEPEWVVAPGGKHRYRTTPEGLVEAERKSRSRRGWSRSWRIVAPNSILSPPILVGPRLCYAGLDDRVTCVRASNGHRLWAVDLGDRISRPLASWPADGRRASDRMIVLAVPDDGASLVALDAYDGRRVAAYELPPFHHFASAPLVVDADRIAIARKGYDDKDSALVLLSLAAPPATGPSPPLPYNGGSPDVPEPSGR